MELIQRLREVFLQVAERVLDLLDGDVDYPTFQQELAKQLNDCGVSICREVLERSDMWIKENHRERKGWVVERKNEPKSVLTPFGLMGFQRTYCHNKKLGEYAYLADRLAGLTPHAKTDLCVKAKLVDSAAEISYRKAGKQAWSSLSPENSMSGQTVMNMIRRTSLDVNTGCCRKGAKARVKYLHVQAMRTM